MVRLFSIVWYLYLCLLPVQSTDYPYGIFLDRDHRLDLRWNVDYEHSIVRFKITVASLIGEWFGVGFSDHGETNNADFMIYWTSATNLHHFQDAWTDSDGLLHVDKHQDYHLVKALSQTGPPTVLQFYREIDTCDPHDYRFDNGTTHILFFISQGTPSSRKFVNVTSLHPGLQRVQLLKPNMPTASMPDDVWTTDVLNPHIEVPAEETTYWWYVTRLPPLKHKHHIIKYEGVIQKGNEGLVHHMEVFHCELSKDEIVRDYNGPGFAEGKPPELEACRNVIGAWAMGAKPLIFPEEAGSPIGGTNYNRYVLLEVHYNNPDKKSGLVDASGIRFYVTSRLRKNDAGIMELGLEYTNKMAIPPRQELFSLTGYCIADCTKIGLPPEGIYIFASQLHTHLTGWRVYTKHVREGVELPEVNRDDHYSPHFQEIRGLPQPVHILPGDALMTICEYKTTDRPNATIGGFAITDEMCVNYVHYYPRVKLEVCKSSIDTVTLDSYFRFMNIWNDDATSPAKGDRANYNSIRWTRMNAYLLNVLYSTSPLSMQCNQSDGNRFPHNIGYTWRPVLMVEEGTGQHPERTTDSREATGKLFHITTFAESYTRTHADRSEMAVVCNGQRFRPLGQSGLRNPIDGDWEKRPLTKLLFPLPPLERHCPSTMEQILAPLLSPAKSLI